MGKPTWVTFDKASGTGNNTVAIGATPHTGRSPRTGVVTIQNQNGTQPSKTVNISQAAKEEFISDVAVNTELIPATGGVIILSGKSNKIQVLFDNVVNCNVGDNTGMSLNSVKVNGVVVGTAKLYNGELSFRPDGDTGTDVEYLFEVSIAIAPNTSPINDLYFTIMDTSSDVSFSITQSAATSTLSVNPDSLSLVTAGTAQKVAITSNDDWKVV